MTPIAAMVLEMISRGVDPDIIGLAVSTAELASSRVEIPQKSADVSAERRREKDRLRKRKSAEIPQKSAELVETPQISKTFSIPKEDSKKDSKRQNRGTRIALDWTVSSADRAFAKQAGFGDAEIDREGDKFRDYWTACAGAKGIKLDWAATWRQWIRNGAERSGRTPPPQSATLPNSFYAAADTEQLDAWSSHAMRTTGKGLPRDRNGGWRVASEWPPDHGRLPLDPPQHREAAE